ncbi:hypothetical protein J2S31_000079 [Nitrospina gracilis Nb-211]|nr:hypothetical protein [Nitrospina gracilis Nb-211]
MFYPVKVLDENGNVKKVLSPKKLSKEYWGKVFDDKNRAPKGKKGKRPAVKNDPLQEPDEYALED